MAARKATKKPNVSADELKGYYKDMLLIRRFEEKAGQLYGMGLIGGFCHLYIGQEAVVVGLEAAAGDGDKRITSYRDHCFLSDIKVAEAADQAHAVKLARF
ncbi:MAG: thiamine pyrophosphate-dependent enzyme, partial [Pseudomonadota bacterium]